MKNSNIVMQNYDKYKNKSLATIRSKEKCIVTKRKIIKLGITTWMILLISHTRP